MGRLEGLVMRRLLTDRELFERRVLMPVCLIGAPALLVLVHLRIL